MLIRQVVAEDASLLAFTGPADQAQWLDDTEARALIAAQPDGNLPTDQAIDLARRTLDALSAVQPRLETRADELAEQLRQMQGQLDYLEQAGLARARKAARVADESVHAHPYGAMGIAAAAGLLVGFLAARR